jgi:hypothetical protein
MGFKKTATTLAALAALAVPSLAASPAHAAAGMKVAIEDEDVFVNGRSAVDPQQGYQFLDQLGIRQMRILISWSSVSSSPGEFDFGAYDLPIALAQNNGVSVQIVLNGQAPKYATANHRVGPYKPSPSAFADFAAAAAAHFRGVVDVYSIWNEPNYKGWLQPLRQAPTLYRNLFIAGYRAIKSTDASAKVLIGETAPYAQGARAMAPLKFLRQMACVDDKYKVVKRCPKIKADGYAHHPYDFQYPPRRSDRGPDNATIGTLPNLLRALTKLQHTRQLTGTRNVYLTEFGYLATGKRGLPEAKRAAYLKQGYQIARRTPRVKQMVQYLLVQPRNPRTSPFTTGVVSSAGDPLRSFYALKSVS